MVTSAANGGAASPTRTATSKGPAPAAEVSDTRTTSRPGRSKSLASRSASIGGEAAIATRRNGDEVMDGLSQTASPAVIPRSGDSGLRIGIVEDHALLGRILVDALQARELQADLVAGQTLDEILQVAERLSPTLILLDLDLGESVGDSLPLIGRFIDMGARVLMLTGCTDRLLLAAALEAGAEAIISKGKDFEELHRAVLAAAAGEELMAPEERHTFLRELRLRREIEHRRLARFSRLTRREREVLDALRRGQRAAAIAAESCTSLATVRTQIRSVLTKLGAGSQLDAVAMAHEAGWSIH